jgi:hypothetical protein
MSTTTFLLNRVCWLKGKRLDKVMTFSIHLPDVLLVSLLSRSVFTEIRMAMSLFTQARKITRGVDDSASSVVGRIGDDDG